MDKTDTTITATEDGSSFTFAVDDVEKPKSLPKVISLVSAKDMIRKEFGDKVKLEDFSHREDDKIAFVQSYGQLSGLVYALHLAYQYHYSLSLSVSDLIILIGQGLGRHIEKHAEELRKHFVDHEGKEQITISRDNFVKGQQNDWSTTFGEFAEEIKKRVKTDIYDVVIDDTSVATKTSRIVSEITLMDAMKSYFDFGCSTMCGIPQITLKGSPEDWQKLQTKVNKLQEMNKDDCLKLKWWLDALVPVVSKICETGIHRKPDVEFWSGIYKYKNPGSGSPSISGWITTFLPYLVSGPNHYPNLHLDTGNIPKQISKVPFKWYYFQETIPMDFYGGFVGAHLDQEKLTVEPVQFWSVNYSQDGEKKSQ